MSFFTPFRNMILGPFSKHTRFYSPSKIVELTDVSRPPLLEIKQFLRSKGYNFTDLGRSSLVLRLPRHDLESSASKPLKWRDLDSSLVRVYVDKRTGRISIPELRLFGTWNNFRSFIVDKIPSLVSPDLRLDKESEAYCSYEGATPVNDLPSESFREIIKALRVSPTKLKKSDFAEFDARALVDKKVLLFPVRLRDDVVGIRKVFFDSKEKRIVEENLFSPRRKEADDRLLPFLHGTEFIQKNTKTVIIVSSVLDSVALRSISRGFVPIAIAEGTRNLPPEHLPFLESIEKIQLWFPNDDSRSLDHAVLFAKKFGEKRCEIMSRECAHPLKFLSQKDADFQSVFKKRMLPCSHEYITTFDSLRESVFLEFLNVEKSEGTKWKRFPPLNEILRGFRRGELTVFSGRTGSGKTTFISEYSLDLCMQGINTLWGSFEVNNVRLVKMQLKQFSLSRLESTNEFDEWADRFQKLPMYYLTFHGSNKIQLILDAMLHSVYVYDIGHVIIDNIQFMMGSSVFRGGDRYMQQDLIIEQFRKFATVHNVHITLVIHPRKDVDDLLSTNSVFGGAKATQEADNVVFLQTESLGTPCTQSKFLQIVKNRYCGDLGIVPLHFNKDTLTFNKSTFLEETKNSKSDLDASKNIWKPPGR